MKVDIAKTIASSTQLRLKSISVPVIYESVFTYRSGILAKSLSSEHMVQLDLQRYG